jgi:indole-3-glycerol phosphate synthase
MSVSKQAFKKGAVLEEIMTYHREQLPKTKRKAPFADLRALISVAPKTVNLFDAIKSTGVTLIAECKKASPSKGLLVRDYDAAVLARKYLQAGARALSVLTDARHFQGSLDDLRLVKEGAVDYSALADLGDQGKEKRQFPILRKDFIFDPYQLYESRAAGADAVLLIAAVLDENELKRLLKLAAALDLQALVEVHNETEINQALAADSKIIGINNRDLQTFNVDLNTTARLRGMIPTSVAVVAESGIKTTDDIRKMAEIGVDAVLVGQTLVQSKDVYETARNLVDAGQSR